jgi:hypothetical protein
MRREKVNVGASSIDLASVVRGLYGRVARQLDLDPSYVSRVARGERRSQIVEVAIEREIHRVLQVVSPTQNFAYSPRSVKSLKRPSRKAVA